MNRGDRTKGRNEDKQKKKLKDKKYRKDTITRTECKNNGKKTNGK